MLLRDYKAYTEEELLASIRSDDKNAFAELFNRYWRKAYVIALSKLQCKDTAEEIVQELFIMLWNKRTTIYVHHFSSFLYTCVRNKCINHIESLIIQKKHWDRYRSLLDETDEGTERKVSYNELLEAINAGMERLPNKTRKVFRLNRLEGRSIPEIATTLNLSEKAIEYHLTRSLKQLRIHLKDFIVMLFVASL